MLLAFDKQIVIAAFWPMFLLEQNHVVGSVRLLLGLSPQVTKSSAQKKSEHSVCNNQSRPYPVTTSHNVPLPCLS